MFRSAGESFVSAGALGLCAKLATVPRTNSRRAAIRLITFLSWGKVVAAAVRQRPQKGLFHGADIIGLTGATSLSGSNVVAVAPAVGRFHVWEGRAITIFIDVYAVTNACAEFL